MRLFHEKLNYPNNGTYPTVAIDGPGGAGKSTFARLLARQTGYDFGLVHGDHYFDPYEQPSTALPPTPGFFNAHRYMQSIGNDINTGVRQLHPERFNWELSKLITNDLFVVDGLIHEGIKALDLPIDWDITVWIDAPRDIRRHRCVELRTDAERQAKGATKAELLRRFETWADEADVYTEKINPQETVQYIVDGEAPAVEQLSDFMLRMRAFSEQ